MIWTVIQRCTEVAQRFKTFIFELGGEADHSHTFSVVTDGCPVHRCLAPGYDGGAFCLMTFKPLSLCSQRSTPLILQKIHPSISLSISVVQFRVPLLPQILGRRHAKMFLKDLTEILGIREAYRVSCLTDVTALFLHDAGGLLEFNGHQELLG